MRAASRLILIVVASLLVLYAFRLAGLVMTVQRASLSERQLQSQVDGLTTEVTRLRTAAVEASSDAAVEEWAREERRWARPGDHTLALLDAEPTPAPSPAPPTLWERLQHLVGAEEDPPDDRGGEPPASDGASTP